MQDRIDDDDPELVPFIEKALNYVQDDICNRHKFRFTEDSENITLATSSHTAEKPRSCQQIIGLRRVSPVEVRRNMTREFVPYQSFRDRYPVIDADTDGTGAATAWTEYGDLLYFNKPADQNYTFAVDFISAPRRMTKDTSVPTIPEEFEELYVIGALMRLMKRDDDYAPKQEEEKDYANLLRQLVLRYGRGTEPLAPRRMPTRFRG